MAEAEAQQRFDSILVRLKALIAAETETELATFRFHTGSIKSLYTRRVSAVYTRFRFHTGSIKRRTSRELFGGG